MSHGRAKRVQPDRFTCIAKAKDYAFVGVALGAFGVSLALLVSSAGDAAVAPGAILDPLLAQVAMVLLVWVLMAACRNYAVMTRRAAADYYLRYDDRSSPPDWVERPARAFNNLMQLPTLFYLACVLMLVTGRIDQAQLALAWVFVGVRLLHAVIYVGWNHLPSRFASHVTGVITLAVLFARFAAQG